MPRKVLSPQRKRFVEAYLTSANGNGTQAAIAAGYSPHTASVQASQLLKVPEVQAQVARTLHHVSLTTEQALANVSAIASASPIKVTTGDVLRANELILRANGALRDKSGDSRITVTIGFLQRHESPDDADTRTTLEAEVLPPRPQVTISCESAPGEAGERAGAHLELAGESRAIAEE